jgi:hypothetical protein
MNVAHAGEFGFVVTSYILPDILLWVSNFAGILHLLTKVTEQWPTLQEMSSKRPVPRLREVVAPIRK